MRKVHERHLSIFSHIISIRRATTKSKGNRLSFCLPQLSEWLIHAEHSLCITDTFSGETSLCRFFTFDVFSQEVVSCALVFFARLTLSDKSEAVLKSILRLADKKFHSVNILFKKVIILNNSSLEIQSNNMNRGLGAVIST